MKDEKNFAPYDSKISHVANTSSFDATVRIEEVDDEGRDAMLHSARVRITFHPLTETWSAEIIRSEVLSKHI